jgi:hypothetical protein
MKAMKKLRNFCLALVLPLWLAACAAPVQKQFDYSAFKAAKPRSILVLPPVNHSPDVTAQASFMATATVPLAESGYYVVPVALAAETFRQNGVTVAEDAQAIAPAKLHEIFGADAGLYLSIERYGVSYHLVESITEAAATAKLLDLRTGKLLWQGKVDVRKSSSDGNNSGIIGALISAAFTQIFNSISDRTAYEMGQQANRQLLSAGGENSILYGPYNPKYETGQ